MPSTDPVNETFNQFQLRIAKNLRKKDVEELKFLFQDHIGDEKLESINSGTALLTALKEKGLISGKSLSKLKKNLKLCGRVDLANKVDPFLTKRAARLKRYNDLNGKFIALSNNNKYVTSTERGEINAGAVNIGPKEKFEVVFLDDDFKIALKSYGQKYLAVGIDRTVSANQDNKEDDSEFTIEFFDTDKVALKSCHDEYVVAKGDLIDANHKEITQREAFTLEFVEIGGKQEGIKTGVQLIKLLEVDKLITADNITNLKSKLKMVGRSDLYDIAVAYERNKAKDAEINGQASNPRITSQNMNRSQSIQDHFSNETTSKVCLTEGN